MSTSMLEPDTKRLTKQSYGIRWEFHISAGFIIFCIFFNNFAVQDPDSHPFLYIISGPPLDQLFSFDPT